MHLQIFCAMLSFPVDRLVVHTELEAFFLSTGQIPKSIEYERGDNSAEVLQIPDHLAVIKTWLA